MRVVRAATARIADPRLLALMFAAALFWLSAAATASASRWGQGYLPNVELLTQDGKTVRFYDDVINDRVTVISFIYTTCRDICPLITARLAEVYERLGEAAGKDIQFVSISIDPENDTPERLKAHADAFRSDQRWLFLTGKPDNVKLVRHKLGERSRKLTEHGAQIMLYNDMTGEWSRDSAFADLGALALAIRSMIPTWRATAGLDAVAVAETSGPSAPELPGQALFAKACATCHSIGQGARVGPDLNGVTARRERDWLTRFMKAPRAMHANKDPIALALAEQFPAVRMPNLRLSDADTDDLIAYLDARSFAIAAAAEDAAAGRPPHDHAAHAEGGGGHAVHHGDHGNHTAATSAATAAPRATVETSGGKPAPRNDGHAHHHGHHHHH